jgi:tetratricopeptide (TPR) repeat protein
MNQLAPLVRKGNAHFLAVEEEILVDEIDQDFDGPMSFDERCDEIIDLIETTSFEDARDQIEDLLQEFPQCAEPLFLMGTCLAMEGKPEEAIPFLNQAISLQPSPEAYYNLAVSHRAICEIEECVNCLNKVIELDGPKGKIGRRAKKEFDNLSSTLRKTSGLTLERFLDNKHRFHRAFDHLLKGRFDEAVAGFMEVLKVQADHVQSYGNLGLAYGGLGERDSAIMCLRKAIELDPDYQPAIDNLRVVLAMPAGERLSLEALRNTDFYAERAKAQRANPSVKVFK